MTKGKDEETLRLIQVARDWKAKGARYFALAETEENALGKKFYESSAMTLLNCIRDLEKATGIEVLNQVDEAPLSPRLLELSSEAQT